MKKRLPGSVLRFPGLTDPMPSPRKARFRAGALGLVALAWLPATAAADIYTYTDSQGVLHFSNRPTGDGRYKLYLKAPEGRAKRAALIIPVSPSDASVDRFNRYDTWIRQAATLYQIPEALVRAVIKCESDYDPRAVSRTGAQGLMQLMPQTALRMQVRDAFDPRENIFGGTRYLRILANTFNGNLELTIAGYNAGEGAVIRYGGIPPYEETQGYVTNVLSFYQRYRASADLVAASSTDG
jgi:soluble lytic murein transglycosylase-like protein